MTELRINPIMFLLKSLRKCNWLLRATDWNKTELGGVVKSNIAKNRQLAYDKHAS